MLDYGQQQVHQMVATAGAARAGEGCTVTMDSPPPKKTVAELRHERGWTLEMMAAQTGFRISMSTINRIERGMVTPERRTREDIAIAFGVTVDQIDWPSRGASESAEG